MYCFKYCPPSVLHFGMLSRGELFFASADELNDGSECRPRYILKGSSELWARLADMILRDAWCFSSAVSPACARNLRALAEPLGLALKTRAGARDLDFERLWSLIHEELPPLLGRVKLDTSPAAFMSLVDQAYGRALHYLNEALYMASFSRNPRDPTMWGHYGGAERGFCIVFNAPEGKLRIQSPIVAFPGHRPSSRPGVVEMGIYSDAEVELKSVLYRSAPLRFNAFHRLIPHFSYSEEEDHYDVPLLLPGEAPARQEDRFGLVKATTWKYEQEVRAFLPCLGELTPEARCVRYDWSQFVGLIFGPKMSKVDRDRAVVCCHLLEGARRQTEFRSTRFVFMEARQRVDSFQMALDAVGVLDGVYVPRFLPFQSLHRTDAPTVAEVRNILAQIQGGHGDEGAGRRG